MDRPSHGNLTLVSAYWTPQHVDVTDVPLRYASPKANWIDGFQRLRPLVTSDAVDRMARRRMHTRANVDPAEITPLPALPPPVPAARYHAGAWLDGVLSAARRTMRTRGGVSAGGPLRT